MKLTRVRDLHKKWMKNEAYGRAYDTLSDEFALVGAMMDARARAGLTQAQVATRMKTTQTAIARLEGGRLKPSTRTLERYARATGHKLVIAFEPVKEKRRVGRSTRAPR
jgi:ribosome-binding protein aMBF1 (putative translation factor)